jgi:hypothetical protein
LVVPERVDLRYPDSQELAETENPDLGLIETKVWRIKPEWEVDTREIPRVTIDESPIHESKKMLGGHRIKSVIAVRVTSNSHFWKDWESPSVPQDLQFDSPTWTVRLTGFSSSITGQYVRVLSLPYI